MNKEELLNLLKELNKESYIDSLEDLMKETLITNESFNLTAIKDEEKFRELMIYDSLLPLKYIDFNGKKVIDVGTGAGFPGLPLAITTSGEFTLLDSTAKKIHHINEYAKNNNINNVIGVTARAEDYASKHRETYDIAVARAVASLPILLELIIPMLKVGGIFVAMKSAKTEEEISLSKNALKKLGSEIINVYQTELPLSKEERTFIIVKKNEITNKKYPRSYSDIKQKSL